MGFGVNVLLIFFDLMYVIIESDVIQLFGCTKNVYLKIPLI